jgi:hypothetical protein
LIPRLLIAHTREGINLRAKQGRCFFPELISTFESAKKNGRFAKKETKLFYVYLN